MVVKKLQLVPHLAVYTKLLLASDKNTPDKSFQEISKKQICGRPWNLLPFPNCYVFLKDYQTELTRFKTTKIYFCHQQIHFALKEISQTISTCQGRGNN